MPLAHNQPSTPHEPRTTDDVNTQQYDTHMAHFVAGDHGQVELAANEDRAAVREMLQAAAQRRGLQLSFRRGRGPLTFHVEALVASAKASAQRPTPPAPAAVAQRVPAKQPAARAAAPIKEAAPAQRPAVTPPPTVAPEPAAPAQRMAAQPEQRGPRPERSQRPPDRRGPRPTDQRATSNRRDAADPRRKSDDRRPANGRYDDMLPRWMREGERPAGQGRPRNDSKRRTRS